MPNDENIQWDKDSKTVGRQRTLRLTDLIKKIRKTNRHEDIDWGRPRGKEVF